MMENKLSDEINTLSSQVLEYYRKYSQDQKLSTYFRGSASKSNDESTANIPSDEIINSEDVNGPNTLTEQEMSRPPLVGQDNELEIDNIDCVKLSSPTSSVASNRKLEWDNGADIGYDNYGKNILHKSLSLPILTTVEHMQLQNVLRLNAEENDSEEIAQIISTVSSSEKSTKSSLKNHSSSSLEIVHQNVEINSSSSSFIKPSENVTDSESSGQIAKNNASILNLVKKVGLPIAESTPIYVISDKNVPCQFDQFDCTPQVKKLKSVSNDGIKFENSLSSDSAKSTSKDTDTATAPTNLNIKENVELLQNEIKKLKQFELTSEQDKSRNKSQKLVLLCITKPLSVECVQYKHVKDKDMQTTLCSKVSIGIQTVNPFSVNCKENSQYEEQQSVIFIKRSDSDSEPDTRSLGTNTNCGDIASNCNSFEYLYGEQFDNLKQSNANNHTNQSKISTDVSSTCYERNSIATNLKRSQVKSDLTALGSGSEENVTSKSSPLGNLIASKQSNNLIPDIDKSIELLQKLLKSKKYDKVTKRYYLEKIIKKILNSTYNSDSSVTSVNDVLTDYTVKELQENHCDVVDIKALSERNLQDNLPWIPGTISNNLRLQSNEKRNRKLEVRTFSAEIIPNHQRNLDTEIMQRTTSKLKNPFTLTGDNGEDLYRKNASSNHDKFILSQSSTPSTLETSDAEVQKFQDWKNDKTLSEKLFEQRRVQNTMDKSRGDGQQSSTSDSDVIVNFAKKERQNQLHWISSEITHLNKLKSLLQKKNDLQIDILTKPHNEMGEPKKSTSVYVITTETSGDSKSSNKEVSSKFHYNSNLESLKSNYAHKVNKYKSKDKIPCTDATCIHQTKICKCASVAQKNNTQMKIDETVVIDENNSPNVKNAKLISKEIYNHGQPNTCIRRYVFEIPVDCNVDEFRNVQKLQKDDSGGLHLNNYKKTNAPTNDVGLNLNNETSDLELHDKIQDNFDINNRQERSVSSVHSPTTDPEQRKPGFSKNGREKHTSDDNSMHTDDELLKPRIQKNDKITPGTQEDFDRFSERKQQKQLKRKGLKEVEVKTRSQEDFDRVSETRHQKQPTKETDDDLADRYDSRDKEIKKKGLKEVEVKTRSQEDFDRVSETRHQKEPTKETDDDRAHRYELRDKEIKKKGLVEVKTRSEEDFDRVSGSRHQKQPTKETDDDLADRYESRHKEIKKKGLKEVEVKTRSQEDFDRVSETRHQKQPTKKTDDDRPHRYESRDKEITKNGLKEVEVKTRTQEEFDRVSETRHQKQPTKETDDDRPHRYESRDKEIKKNGLKEVEVKTRSQEEFDRVSETRHQKQPTKETDNDRPHRYESRDKEIKKKGLKEKDVKTRSQEEFDRVSETRHQKQPTKESDDDLAHRYESRDKQIKKKGLKEKDVKTRSQEEFDRVSETRHQKQPTKETDNDRPHRYESRHKEIKKKALKEVEVKTRSQEEFDRVSETRHQKQPTKETDDDRPHRYESRDKEIKKKVLKEKEVKTRSQEDFDRVSETRHQKQPMKESDDDLAHRYELRDKEIKKKGLKEKQVKTRSQEDFDRLSETRHQKQPTKEADDDRALRYELRDNQSTTSSEMPIDQDNNERYADSKLSKKEIASDSETSTDTARKRPKNARNLNNSSQKITRKESSEDKLKKISSNNKSEDGNITEKAQNNLDSNSNKRTQTDKKTKNDVFSSSSSSSTESTSSDSSESYCTGVCPCCKQNEASKRVRNIATSLQNNIQRALCQPCYVQSQQTNWPHSKPYYTYPGHVCNCYTLIKTDTVNEIQRTVEELDRLENDWCTCRYNKSKICNCTRGIKQKKSIGYTLTFENGNPESEEDIKRNRSLEEIKIRIPYREKTNKDYESRKRHKKKHSNKSKSGKENSQDSIKNKHSHKKDKKSKHVTLQDYLCLNRPNFIETAEQRRKCMVDLAYLREQRCQKYKQLLAMTNGVCLNNDNMEQKNARMFSSKEMKQITAKNYKKLPEVQKKLEENRDKRIKTANRLLADIFNKNLQKNALKGNITLSTTASVIKLN